MGAGSWAVVGLVLVGGIAVSRYRARRSREQFAANFDEAREKGREAFNARLRESRERAGRELHRRVGEAISKLRK